MEPDGKTYLLPYPLIARVIATCAGAFALFIAPYELWRGVWPLNLTTPFFAFILVGGMSVGANFVWAGLAGSSAVLRFEIGSIELETRNVWGKTSRRIHADEIAAFEVKEQQNSDGPNDWYAVIRTTSGSPIASRPLSTREAAERQLAEFQRAFAGPPQD